MTTLVRKVPGIRKEPPQERESLYFLRVVRVTTFTKSYTPRSDELDASTH